MTLIKGSDIMMDILKKVRPKEARLKHLCSNLRGACMSSTWRIMAMGDYALNFLLGEAMPIDSIFPQLVEK